MIPLLRYRGLPWALGARVGREGALGLPTFERTCVCMDLAGRRLPWEGVPPAGSHELRVRVRRDGPAVDRFAEVRAPTRALWLEIDTANTGPVILSPEAAADLGLAPGVREAVLDLGGGCRVAAPYVVKPIRYDGNLGAPFFASRPLTIDVTNERAWLGPAP